MPGAVRQGDAHVGHASGTPNPFHRTTYVSGQSTVYVNGRLVIRKTDKTSCGDPAFGCSGNVYAEEKPIHRLGDSTSGHGTWVPNAAAQASSDVIVNAAETTTQSNSPSVTVIEMYYRHYVVINYSGDIRGSISATFSGDTDNLVTTGSQITFSTLSKSGTLNFIHSGTGANGFSTISSDNGGSSTWDGTTLGNLTTVNGGTTTFTLVAQGT